jgi:hypothetical protein
MIDPSGRLLRRQGAHDSASLTDLLTTEQLGRKVSVGEKDGRNVFRPL